MMKKTVTAGILAATIAGGFAGAPLAFATSSSNTQNTGSQMELHLTEDGKITLKGAKVNSVSGSTIKAVTAKGAYSFEWTIETDGNTKFTRRFGSSSGLNEIEVGDYIAVSGMFDFGTSRPTIRAKAIQDWSIQRSKANFSGRIKSIATSTTSFILSTAKNGDITVETGTTTKFMRGNARIAFSDLRVGDEVNSTSGLYNTTQKTLEADTVRVSPRPAIHPRRVFQGVLNSVGTTTAPATLNIKVGGNDYTVKVATDTAILDRLWARASLSEFRAGDRIRVYGGIEVSDPSVIQATVVRNISIR